MQPNPNFNAVNMLFMLVVFAIWYFLLIRPQQKKQKEHQAMIGSLKKNDDIVTSGGIHGTIVNVKDKTCILRVDDAARIEIDKNCVVYVKNKEKA